MKKCMKCGKYNVKNPNHDLCHDCWEDKEEEEEESSVEDSFEEDLEEDRIYTVYVMFYDFNKEKIGYTVDLNSRIMELKRAYPNNRFVYFREFVRESEARRFEAWLKELSKRELMKFVSKFQDKARKVELI